MKNLRARIDELTLKQMATDKDYDSRMKTFENMMTQKTLKKHEKELRYMQRTQAKAHDRNKAALEAEVQILQDSIRAIHNQDMDALQKAHDNLIKHVKEVNEDQKLRNQDFLALLAGDADPKPFGCPYCGAQCIETCLAKENGQYGKCLGVCAAADPSL